MYPRKEEPEKDIAAACAETKIGDLVVDGFGQAREPSAVAKDTIVQTQGAGADEQAEADAGNQSAPVGKSQPNAAAIDEPGPEKRERELKQLAGRPGLLDRSIGAWN